MLQTVGFLSTPSFGLLCEIILAWKYAFYIFKMTQARLPSNSEKLNTAY